MQLPLAYIDAPILEEVSMDAWRALFEALGWPPLLAGRRDAFTHGDLLDALSQTESDEVLQALEAIHTLGTEAGREAIVNAMRDRRVPLSDLPADCGDREFALYLYLGQRSSASLADVFVRAQIQAQETGDHRRYNEYLGVEPRNLTGLESRKAALRTEVLQLCAQNDLGDHVEVRAFEDAGTFVFSVLRSHHTKKPVAIVPGHAARMAIQFRPVLADLIRYEPVVGRLRVAARVPSFVEFYRKCLGRVLFGNEEFFSGDPVCTLAVLQEKGRKAIEDHCTPGVGRVVMTECIWERGDRELHHIRSADCFRHIDELRLPLAEGQLIQAKFKLEVAGRTTRPVSVTIRVPSRIEVSRPAYERIVDMFLSNIGVRVARPRRGNVDLWTLFPWRHRFGVWRSLFGSDADVLAREGVLVPIRLSAVESLEHRDAGPVLDAHDVSPGEYYGVSRTAEIPSRSLSSTDLEALRLEPERLRVWLQSRLACSGGSTYREGDDFLDLGVVDLGGQGIALAYAIRPPSQGIGGRLRMREAGARHVLLMPSEHFENTELAHIILDRPLPILRELISKIASVSGIGDAVPANVLAPEDARLVVDTRLNRVWFDTVAVAEIRAGTHPYRLVETLARYAPSAVDMRELSSMLSAAHGTDAARQAKRDAKRFIERALSAVGRELESDPFPTGPKGFYRCAVVPFVR